MPLNKETKLYSLSIGKGTNLGEGKNLNVNQLSSI